MEEKRGVKIVKTVEALNGGRGREIGVSGGGYVIPYQGFEVIALLLDWNLYVMRDT